MWKKLAVALILLLVTALWYLPYGLEGQFNRVIAHAPYSISNQASRLHSELNIMDWHADTLLWKRAITDRVSRGHVDLSRLQQGNVALQMLTVVTKSPSGQNYERNGADSDRITSLVVAQRWPVRTWNSLYERALYQAEKLAEAQQDAAGDLIWVRSRDDLQQLMQARQSKASNPVGVMLGMEGAHPLEGKIEHVQHFYDAGYRMIGLQHFFDNELGGSLHGVSQQGLTPFGREVVAELDRLGMLIDVAHSSEQVVRDVLAQTQRPIVVSHTGFKGLCDTPRNISDELMQAIAAKGGIIAIGYWPAAVCDTSPSGIASMLKYGIELVGAEHVALGSDFDGSVVTALDTSELAAITQALLDLQVSEAQIAQVMGQSSLNFLFTMLPE